MKYQHILINSLYLCMSNPRKSSFIISFSCNKKSVYGLNIGIPTYIHIWLLQPFSQNYDLPPHITFVVPVNFMHERYNLQFKVDFERQIFEKLFMAILFTLRDICQKSAERKSPKKCFHIFVMISDLGFEIRSYIIFSQAFLLSQYSFICEQYFKCSDI